MVGVPVLDFLERRRRLIAMANPAARDALRVLIQQARDQRHMAFLFVNNRLEGNAPLTIMAITEPDD